GDDITAFPATVATTRVGNYTQISRKLLITSDTEEVVDKAGRKSEQAYQMAKRAAELKRDLEAIMLANQGAVAGSTVTARKTGSVLAWIKTNTDKGASGVDPVYTTIPTGTRTDGTLRAFTETILKNVLQLAWTQGGSPDIVFLGGLQKQVASGFAGVATKTLYQGVKDQTPSVIVGAADVYVSDFGKVSIVADRFQRNRDGLVIDSEYWTVAFLRPFKTVELAKTGDA